MKYVVISIVVLLFITATSSVAEPTKSPNEFEKKLEIQFVRIPAGSFQMGDIQGDGRSSGKPVHEVTIAKPFYMSKTEITQTQWRKVMGNNPSKFKGDDFPVEQVSWDAIRAFIIRLNQLTGKAHRLPSEAEWEYAARAGSKTKYSWGNSISHNNANYGTDDCCKGLESGADRWEKTSPVGSFSPNAFGLYDMHGNVSEWTQDCWNKSYRGAPTDGSAWLRGKCYGRVCRGGSWGGRPEELRSAIRKWGNTFDRHNDLGFRLIQDR